MFVVLSAAGSSGVFKVVGVVAVVGGSCALSGFSVCCYLLMLFCVLFWGFCGLQGRRGRPGSSGRRGSSLSSEVIAVVGGRRGSSRVVGGCQGCGAVLDVVLHFWFFLFCLMQA